MIEKKNTFHRLLLLLLREGRKEKRHLLIRSRNRFY